jgi:hypothetical protein
VGGDNYLEVDGIAREGTIYLYLSRYSVGGDNYLEVDGKPGKELSIYLSIYKS